MERQPTAPVDQQAGEPEDDVGFAALADEPEVEVAEKPPAPKLDWPADWPTAVPPQEVPRFLPDPQARVAVTRMLAGSAALRLDAEVLASQLMPGTQRDLVQRSAGLAGQMYDSLAAAAGLLATRSR